MASIYGFATQSGGCITCDSEVGEGTTFNVYLPRSTEINDEVSDTPLPVVATSTKNQRVLVVEDNELVCNLTVKRLRAMGFETLAAYDGPAALEILETQKNIDLVLSDVVMAGGLSGYEVAHWVQNNRPECRLLLTTGFNENLADENNVLDSGLDILHKPYSLEELKQAIANCLD